MKRHAWLTVGLGLSLVVAACNDDDSGGDSQGTVDGGLSPADLSAEIRDLQGQLDKLGMDQTGLGGRLTVLETPKVPGTCSAGELCIPDGISLSKQGMDPIIQALCTRETTCCGAGELNYLYGPAIKNATDCVASFTDIVNNGISESNNTFSQYLYTVVTVAHALNDTNVHMELSATGIAACAAAISGRACPTVGTAGPPGCQPSDYSDDNGPCSVESLAKGLEREGDTCTPYTDVPECGEGLVCRGDFGNEGPQSGICAPKVAAGDHCTSNEDCDDLFCNFATGLCQVRAKEGQACAYVDPSFKQVDPWYNEWPYYGGQGQNAYVDVTKVDCEQGLTCDPLTNTCAKNYCSKGAFCRSNGDCPTNNVCTRGNDALLAIKAKYASYNIPFVGVCAAAFPEGAACEPQANECASHNCDDVAVPDEYKCQPGNFADGTQCTIDATCASNHCGADLKCSPVCDLSNSTCQGAACRACAAGSYCTPYSGTVGRCETLIPDGNPCDFSFGVDAGRRAPGCASGYCNASNLCAPKVLANGTCTAGHHGQCQNDQFCSGTTCTTTTALGANCTTATECGPKGACWDVDGPALSGVVKRCFEGNGTTPVKVPNGTYCSADNQCESSWCRSNGTTTVCTKLLDDGAACDLSALNHCASESFCATVVNTTAGVCKKLGLVGDLCEPRFNGGDCLAKTGCQLQHEAFLCDSRSLPRDKVWCQSYED